MEEQKTEIVEKRLSRRVIRRRSRTVAEEEKAKKAPEKKKVLKLDDDASAAKVAPAQPVAPQTPAPTEKKLRLDDDTARKQAESVVAKNLKLDQKSADAAPAPEQAKVDEKIISERVIKPKEQQEEKKVEKPRVLKFKDRVKGTIDLTKFKGKEETISSDDDSRDKPKKVFRDGTTTTEEDADRNKKDKAPRAKRSGVKTIGGDLDIEGMGRAVNLTQYTRTAPTDRVFRPGMTPGRRKKKIVSKKNLKQTVLTEKKASKRVIEIDQSISVGNLAQELGIKASDIIRELMKLEIMATINQEIDRETAALIASEHQYEVKDISFKEEEVLAGSVVSEEEMKDAQSRPPVVTVMGHVDHGKTSLLDAIRATNVTKSEAGGITQHIGAYTVELPQGRITFLDTPGHEAFTTMRARGAQVTDIVILVVAADDGLMPQTIESIDHAKAAGVPIIVAVNKMDKPEANPDNVKRQLSEKGLLVEDWGGDVISAEVSALKKKGIKELLESVLLQAEILELKAPVDSLAHGTVLEARLDKGRGTVATLLVQSGTLKRGDYLVAGTFSGRIKAMHDWKGDLIKDAGPSYAVEILGLDGVPDAGDKFNAVKSEQDAKKVAEHRIEENRRAESGAQGGVSLEDMFSRMKSGQATEMNMILKADVQGSLEAVKDAVMKIGNEEVQPKIIHTGVGGINESDVRLAMASEAVIIGFNVRPETKALHSAKDNKIEIKLYKVIYDLVNEVKLAMEGLLAPEIKENYLGRAEVRQTFEVSKIGMIAGCMVVDGRVTRNANLRLLRDNVVIFEGKVESLKRFKDDAKEVKQGFECGIGIEGYKDIKDGDVIEAFELQEIQKTL